VPTDYEKIRQENLSRYGWDTAVLDLLGQLYSDRTHFIYELLQNAEDAGATELTFELFEDRLEIRHDGRPFTEADVRGICGVANSPKAGDLTNIGKFGIGFKSVYAYTKSPAIHSGSESFRIERYVQPHQAEPFNPPVASTVVILPFDHPEVPASAASQEISSALSDLAPRTLLFLRNIRRVRIRGLRLSNAVLERADTVRPGSCRDVRLSDSRGDGSGDEEWRVWHRPVPASGEDVLRVELAFHIGRHGSKQQLLRSDESPLVVFFPTAKETFLGFLIQGPYRTTPARDNIPEHDPWNQTLVRETALLLTSVLRQLRDDGLLTADVLQAMPLAKARFQAGTMFRPLFDAVRDSLGEDQLIPVAGSGYRSASELKLARGAGLRELLEPDQLGDLYQTAPVCFAHESITENRTPELWRYLREELGVDEVTPEAVVARITADFLAARSDSWICSFYVFLNSNQALWKEPRYQGEQPGPARAKPIIRLEDGSQVLPFNDRGLPAAYLPGPTDTEFPTIRRDVAGFVGARLFLEGLGFTRPDVVAEILDKILPRYADLDINNLNHERHDTDLERITRAMAEAGSDRKQQLYERLRQTAFLIGENAKTRELRLMTPGSLYLRTEELEMYFASNPGTWFARNTYGRWLNQLLDLGVRDKVIVRAQRPDYQGYVILANEWGSHERGVDGFDPGAWIDGLDFALGNPNPVRSEYVWNTLLAPNRQILAGAVEKSSRAQFVDAIRTEQRSHVGVAARDTAWLPGTGGSFCQPGEVQLTDLPPEYKRDEVLAKALGMVQPVVEEASRQLGLSAGVLRGLSEYPDLVEKVTRELEARAAARGESVPGKDGGGVNGRANGEIIDYASALSNAFNQPGQTAHDGTRDEDPASGIVSDPGLRRERVGSKIEEDKKAEPPAGERFSLVPRRTWEAKDSAVKHFLTEHYKGRCQICDQTFLKRDGTPYFEGLYLVSSTRGRWFDRPGNVISVCATCCAKFQHGSVDAPDILDQIRAWRPVSDDGDGRSELKLRLCDDYVLLRFKEKHLLDLQLIIKGPEMPDDPSTDAE